MTPCRITGAADVAAITAKPYDDFIAAHSVIDALERVALRHGERNALAYIAAPDLALPAQVWTHARCNELFPQARTTAVIPVSYTHLTLPTTERV